MELEMESLHLKRCGSNQRTNHRATENPTIWITKGQFQTVRQLHLAVVRNEEEA